ALELMSRKRERFTRSAFKAVSGLTAAGFISQATSQKRGSETRSHPALNIIFAPPHNFRSQMQISVTVSRQSSLRRDCLGYSRTSPSRCDVGLTGLLRER